MNIASPHVISLISAQIVSIPWGTCGIQNLSFYESARWRSRYGGGLCECKVIVLNHVRGEGSIRV